MKINTTPQGIQIARLQELWPKSAEATLAEDLLMIAMPMPNKPNSQNDVLAALDMVFAKGYTRNEAAVTLHCSPHTVDRWIKQTQKALGAGGFAMIPRDETVESYMEKAG